MIRCFAFLCIATLLCSTGPLEAARASPKRSFVGTITPYRLPSDGDATAITSGPDGNLWFVDTFLPGIDRMTTAGAVTGEFVTPHAADGAWGIATGPDGNLWFTEQDDKNVGRIGRITTAGAITEYTLPAGSDPSDITSGPDGNLWFAQANAQKIGRITPAGEVTEFAVGGALMGAITAGPDGNLWFVECGGAIGRITTAGTIREFPARGTCDGQPSIVRGPDGKLWFANGGHIGRISLSGVITQFVPRYDPDSIAAGPDGNVWFVKREANLIGRITPAGVLTKFPTKFGQAPAKITVGPDGNLWITAGNKVAKIT